MQVIIDIASNGFMVTAGEGKQIFPTTELLIGWLLQALPRFGQQGQEKPDLELGKKVN